MSESKPEVQHAAQAQPMLSKATIMRLSQIASTFCTAPNASKSFRQKARDCSNALETLAEAMYSEQCLLPQASENTRAAIGSILSSIEGALRRIGPVLEEKADARRKNATRNVYAKELRMRATPTYLLGGNYYSIDLDRLRLHTLSTYAESLYACAQAMETHSLKRIEHTAVASARILSNQSTLHEKMFAIYVLKGDLWRCVRQGQFLEQRGIPPVCQSDASRESGRHDGIQLKSQISDISPLLEPWSHFASLEALQDRIKDLLGMNDLDDSQSFEETLSEPAMKAGLTMSHTNHIRSRLTRLMQALHAMQRAQFCDRTITYFSRHEDLPYIVQAEYIDIDSIERVVQNIGRDSGSEDFDVQKFRRRVDPIFEHLPEDMWGRFSGASRFDDKRWFSLTTNALCFLETNLLLYLNANTVSDLWIGDKSFDGRMLEDAVGGALFCCERSRLTCMDKFIQEDIWVWGQKSGPWPEAHHLLISPHQLADLWGPASVTPSNTGRFQLLHLEGGILYRSGGLEESVVRLLEPSDPRQKHSDRRIKPPMTALMHFVPISISPDKLSTGLNQETVKMRISTEDIWPDDFPEFSLDVRFLIGYPPVPRTENIQCTKALGPITSSIKPRSSLDSASLFDRHIQCSLGMEDFEQENAHRIQALDTCPERNTPESFQLSLSGGQYLNVGFQKTWKRLPARTHKTMLLDYILRPGAKISTVLDLWVGVEVSLCTGNVRRTSLLDTLKIAFPQEVDAIDQAYSQDCAAVIAPYLASLKDTGIRDDDKFYAYWPLTKGYPEGIEMSRPAWASMLKDMHTSGCFATASFACLGYSLLRCQSPARSVPIGGRDSAQRGLRCPALLTTIVLKTDCHRDIENYMLWLDKYHLVEGHLKFRKVDLGRPLAFYHPKSWKDRVDRVVGGKIGEKSPNEVGRELLDPKRARYAQAICILDAKDA